MKFKWLALCLLVPTLVFAQASSFEPFSAEYSFEMGKAQVGILRYVVEAQANNTYSFQSTGEGKLGLFSIEDKERAVFKIENNQIMPLSYSYDKQEVLNRRQGTIKFNWDQKKVTGTFAKLPWEEKLTPGSIDILSHILQLQLDLRRNPQQQQFKYRVIRPGKIREFEYKVTDTPKVEVPFGSFDTIEVEHYHERRNRRTKYYFAPELNYALVKMHRTEGGQATRQAKLKHFTR